MLAIAVIGLYVLHFNGTATKTDKVEEPGTGAVMPEDIAIAYIIEDSLLNKYEYFKELAEALGKKQKDAETDYTLKAQGLQKEIEGFQRTAGNMTMAQARAVEEDLVRKRQNMMMLQEKIGQDMMREESQLNQKLYNKISEFLNSYAIEHEYSLILNFKRGNAVMYGHPGMDITSDVLNGLNTQYEETKEVGKKATKDIPVSTDTTSTNN